jgi:hypothetical protein
MIVYGLLPIIMIGCEAEEANIKKPISLPPAVEAPAVKEDPPEPVQEPLVGGPFPGLLVSQAWFWKGSDGKPNPGPARLEVLRDTPDGWKTTRVEDAESNVFHKAVPYRNGILTIGAEGANLKHWTATEGKWSAETLWAKSWGGKFNRLRDLEIGDVDGDGKDELVIATHDAGVIAVIDPAEGDTPQTVIELDQKADTFVHEIEIGDIDGDGKMEFFATPTDRNKANASQGGQMVMYKFDGYDSQSQPTYVRTVVDPFGKTHAKEILAADLNGDGVSELFSVVEAETIGKSIINPVEIRQYQYKDGVFTPTVITTIDDRQTRFLVPGDFDHDGKTDLVAAAMSSGLWLLKQSETGAWENQLIDSDSSGFEHTSYGADLDKDGRLELYVAADEQGELNRYLWDGSQFQKTKIGTIPENTITWNIVSGVF